MMQCGAVGCSGMQCVAMWCSVMQCDAACCNVLQRVAVCCSVLQCVAVCCTHLTCRTHFSSRDSMLPPSAMPRGVEGGLGANRAWGGIVGVGEVSGIGGMGSLPLTCTLQHAATHKTLQHTVTHHTLQHTATHNTLQHTAAFNTLHDTAARKTNTLQHTATHHTLQHTATHDTAARKTNTISTLACRPPPSLSVPSLSLAHTHIHVPAIIAFGSAPGVGAVGFGGVGGGRGGGAGEKVGGSASAQECAWHHQERCGVPAQGGSSEKHANDSYASVSSLPTVCNVCAVWSSVV